MEQDNAVPSEDECWLDFWDVMGQAAYRIWRDEQQAARSQAAELPLAA